MHRTTSQSLLFALCATMLSSGALGGEAPKPKESLMTTCLRLQTPQDCLAAFKPAPAGHHKMKDVCLDYLTLPQCRDGFRPEQPKS